MGKSTYKKVIYKCDNCSIKMKMFKRKDKSLGRYHATAEYEAKGKTDLYSDDNDYLWISLTHKKAMQGFEFEYVDVYFCSSMCAQRYLSSLRDRDTAIQNRREKYSRKMGHKKS